jgi:putative transposase
VVSGVSYETIRRWCAKFGPAYPNRLRRRRPRPGDKCHLDEVFVKINGLQRYLWRAVDQHGNVLDVLVQSRRNAKAARKFFRKLLRGLRYVPRVLVTDTLASYGPAHGVVMPSVEHRQSKDLNNRAENSHQPDPATRAGDETLQINPARAKVLVGVQRHLAAFPAPSTPAVGGRVPTGDGRPLRGLERDHRDDRRLKVNWDRSFHQNRRTTRER